MVVRFMGLKAVLWQLKNLFLMLHTPLIKFFLKSKFFKSHCYYRKAWLSSFMHRPWLLVEFPNSVAELTQDSVHVWVMCMCTVKKA